MNWASSPHFLDEDTAAQALGTFPAQGPNVAGEADLWLVREGQGLWACFSINMATGEGMEAPVMGPPMHQGCCPPSSHGETGRTCNGCR